MFEEIWDEAKDFFEDIWEHLTEKDEEKHKDSAVVAERTKLAYNFTERVDSLMKIVFGISILVSAVISSIWGFTTFSDLIKALIESVFGRIVLSIIGLSYLINGIWRMFHVKN